jgi:putative ABC transport system ATP-binding protein
VLDLDPPAWPSVAGWVIRRAVGEAVAVTDPPTAPLFAFEEVWVSDGAHTILSGVTAELEDGGITAITGASGSGKSTLLRLCNRLVVPSSGTIRFRGSDLMSLDPVRHRRRVGMVFQRPTPFPGTVMENLMVAAALDREAAAGGLERVGLDRGLLDRDASTLSGGEAQRMCLARTLATGCEVLLADEMTSALDAEAAAILESLAVELARGGMTVLWVTHDEAQQRRIADRTLHLEAGRVVRTRHGD